MIKRKLILTQVDLKRKKRKLDFDYNNLSLKMTDRLPTPFQSYIDHENYCEATFVYYENAAIRLNALEKQRDLQLQPYKNKAFFEEKGTAQKEIKLLYLWFEKPRRKASAQEWREFDIELQRIKRIHKTEEV